MGYNPQFRINPEQLDIIETALRAEVGRLAEPVKKNWNEVDQSKVDKESIRKLTDVLAHLHDQKVWYKRKDHVPVG